jgi:hypothetical protein
MRTTIHPNIRPFPPSLVLARELLINWVRGLVCMILPLWSSLTAVAQSPFTLDPTFVSNIHDGYINSAYPVPDGGVVISGQFRFEGMGPVGFCRMARLDISGDTMWTIRGMPPYDTGGKVAPWEGRVYASTLNTLYRYHLDGTIDSDLGELNDDPRFQMGTLQDYHPFADGRVLVAGAHVLNDPANGFDGTYGLIWFTADGSLDTTRVHRSVEGTVYKIEPLPNGKFLCSMVGTGYDGTPVPALFRIEADGSLDLAFSGPVLEYGGMRTALTLTNERVLVGGTFRVEGEQDTVCVMSLLPDGSLDPAFHRPVFRDTTSFFKVPAVASINELPDGKLVISGHFDFINDQPRTGLALLNADGTLSDDLFTDHSCGHYTEPLGYGGPYLHRRWISGVVATTDGGYYIHGAYRRYDDGAINDTLQRFVSRMYGLEVGITPLSAGEGPGVRVYPNPAHTYVTVDLEQPITDGKLLLRDALGREVWQQRVASYQNTVPLHGLGSGVYLVELWDGGERRAAQRVVVQ